MRHQIKEKEMNDSYDDAVAAYAAGAPVCLVTSMGSCWCGDTEGIMQNGMITCRGKYKWQNYAGPVEGCRVGYGMAELAKAIHAQEQRPSTQSTQSTSVARFQRWKEEFKCSCQDTTVWAFDSAHARVLFEDLFDRVGSIDPVENLKYSKWYGHH